jgi:hypothetical protein
MRMRLFAGSLAMVSLVVACGTSGGFKTGGPDATMMQGDSGGMNGPDAMKGSDGGQPPPTDTGTGMTDASMPPIDTGPGPWNGTFAGPLTCSTTGSYSTVNCATTSEVSSSDCSAKVGGCCCGLERWDVKTGTDSAAGSVSLMPTLTTIAALTSIPSPSPFPTSGTPRTGSTENTCWALKDVSLIFARLEDDSDYHLVLSDGTTTMITEVPYPGCFSGGPWACLISRARAAVEAKIGLSELVWDQGHDHSYTVSAVGVGFWDPEHGQFDTAPNNVELHAILSICFGAGCNPSTD